MTQRVLRVAQARAIRTTPSGSVADSLDEAKAAFRAAWDAQGKSSPPARRRSELLNLVANLDARANPTIAIPHQLSPAPVAVRRGIDWRWRNINWSGGVVITRGRRPNNRPGSETTNHASRNCSAFGLSVGWYRRADDERADRQNDRSIHVRLHLGWSTTYA